jgi:hypothetical protein
MPTPIFLNKGVRPAYLRRVYTLERVYVATAYPRPRVGNLPGRLCVSCSRRAEAEVNSI